MDLFQYDKRLPQWWFLAAALQITEMLSRRPEFPDWHYLTYLPSNTLAHIRQKLVNRDLHTAICRSRDDNPCCTAGPNNPIALSKHKLQVNKITADHVWQTIIP